MIAVKNVSRTFCTADNNTVEALKNVSLTIEDGDIYGIIGMSGAGKSTLIRCINMLERPDDGTVEIDGCDLRSLNEAKLRDIRRKITMIFQGFNLLMQRNCLKNVCFPLELAGVPRKDAKKRAMELLELVDLGDKARLSFREVSSSVSRLRERLRPTRRYFFATRLQARWIQPLRIRF